MKPPVFNGKMPYGPCCGRGWSGVRCRTCSKKGDKLLCRRHTRRTVKQELKKELLTESVSN
jgi:hypothetical protein